MGKVKFSKKRMVAQSKTSSLKYMQPLAAGTVLTIQDILRDSFMNGTTEVLNDNIICTDQEGLTIKLPVREYAKMKLEGDAYNSESDSDEISLPNQIVIVSSEDRIYKEKPLYPTFAYNDAQAFLDSKGAMTFDELIASGLKDDNKFAPVQNYTGKVS
jgi:hypothetical protein